MDTRDRKEYFKHYAKKRYESQRKLLADVVAADIDGKTYLQLQEEYKQAVIAWGYQGQKNWRHRKKLKEKIFNRAIGIDHVAAIKHLLGKVKRAAKTRGIEFNLSVGDLILPKVCPILGIPLDYESKGVFKPDQASVDRIDNNFGYVPGNVQIISLRANILKRDATLQELRQLGEWAAHASSRKAVKSSGAKPDCWWSATLLPAAMTTKS